MTELVKSLTAVELSTLDKHEAVINRGLKTFADVGNSLLAIRDGRLYREQHGTFEEYCRERWGFTDRRARMLMSASEVVERIGKTGTTVPVNEAQARPLARLPAAEQPEAWEAASNKAKEESRPVTARDVEAEVEKRTSRDPLDTGRTAEETEVQEDKDSATLYHLKRYWNMATKKDRKQFRRWMDENKD